MLAQLFPCTVKDLSENLISKDLDATVLDNFYLANFTDDFLRRWFHYSLGQISNPYTYTEPDIGRFLNGKPPEVKTAWDFSLDGEQIVRAYVSYPDAPVSGTGWLVNFVKQDDAWKIDEYAWAVLDSAPEFVGWPTTGTSVTDVFLFDPDQSVLAGAGASWVLPTDGPVYSGDGLTLRMYNFSSVETTVTFADLDLAWTIAPGQTRTVWLNPSPGKYRMLVYQDGKASSEGPMYVTFMEPGTEFQGNG